MLSVCVVLVWVLLQQCAGQGATVLDCMWTITPSLLCVWRQMQAVCVCVWESGGGGGKVVTLQGQQSTSYPVEGGEWLELFVWGEEWWWFRLQLCGVKATLLEQLANG